MTQTPIERFKELVDKICSDPEGAEKPYEEHLEKWAKVIIEETLLALSQAEEAVKMQKEDLERFAEWLDTRLMNGDWDDAGVRETMLAENLRTEEDIKEKVRENLCIAENLEHVLSAIASIKEKYNEKV